MSSSSIVTYTSVYSESEPWRLQWDSDDEMEAPDAALQPEEPEQAPLSSDYDQPLLADASPISLSPGYVADSNSEKNEEEDYANYPADGGDDDDESSDDDDDDEEEEEEEEEQEAPEEDEDEEEEHLLHYLLLTMAKTSVRPQTYMGAATDALIAAVVVALPSSSPPPSLLSLLLSPLPHISSPPQPVPAPSSPLLLPATDSREDILEADLPPQKRLCLTAPTLSFVDTVDATPGRYMSREVGYGITNVWDDKVRDMEETAPTTLEAVNQRVVDLSTTLAHDTHERSTCYVETDAIEARTLKAREPARTDDPEDADSRVATALAEHEANKSKNGDDSHNSGSGGRRQVPTTRKCTYSDFLKCQPLNFKGTEGVVGLTQWFEMMESVFRISNCTVANQVKFATCTLLKNALTWWNSHIKTVGHDVAYGMP
ncbi:hypothetical protein Tco_1098878 [Tanacetum coccineum]